MLLYTIDAYLNGMKGVVQSALFFSYSNLDFQPRFAFNTEQKQNRSFVCIKKISMSQQLATYQWKLKS